MDLSFVSLADFKVSELLTNIYLVLSWSDPVTIRFNTDSFLGYALY